jgi:hypothetical protein
MNFDIFRAEHFYPVALPEILNWLEERDIPVLLQEDGWYTVRTERVTPCLKGYMTGCLVITINGGRFGVKYDDEGSIDLYWSPDTTDSKLEQLGTIRNWFVDL